MSALRNSTLLFILLLLWACQGERYRKDRTNQMTKKAKVASSYLSIQAVKVTHDNIENKPENFKSSRKRMEKMQKDLNELNSKTSKVKKPKKHSGEFNFY